MVTQVIMDLGGMDAAELSQAIQANIDPLMCSITQADTLAELPHPSQIEDVSAYFGDTGKPVVEDGLNEDQRNAAVWLSLGDTDIDSLGTTREQVHAHARRIAGDDYVDQWISENQEIPDGMRGPTPSE